MSALWLGIKYAVALMTVTTFTVVIAYVLAFGTTEFCKHYLTWEMKYADGRSDP